MISERTHGPEPPSSETALLTALRCGDEDAFSALVDAYGAAMHRVALTFVRSRAVADEVVQEAWLGALRGLDRFEGRSALRTWLLRIVANIARTHAVREARTVPFSSLELAREAGAEHDPALPTDHFQGPGEQHPCRWVSFPMPWSTEPESAGRRRVRRVLVGRVVAKLEPGGAQLSLLRVAGALARRGHQTRLLAGIATPAGVELARAHGFDPEVMGAEVDLQWHCDPAFVSWLEPRLGEADVVHAHMLGAWWAAAHALSAGVPLVASEHNSYEWWGEPPWAAMAEVGARVDRFYGHGPGARAGALRVGVPEGRIRAGVSPVAGMGARPRPGLPSPRIMFTGRFSPDKAPDVLVEAVARMAAPPPVLMLGVGVLEDDLHERVARFGLERVVGFGGWVDEPGAWVAGAAAQACPSRDEAFSQTAVLAMGLGVPVVGTDVDGFPDTLAGRRGIIVSSEDPEALARALEDVLSGRRRPDIAAARVWARQFDVERVATVYERSYDELCPAVVS